MNMTEPAGTESIWIVMSGMRIGLLGTEMDGLNQILEIETD